MWGCCIKWAKYFCPKSPKKKFGKIINLLYSSHPLNFSYSFLYWDYENLEHCCQTLRVCQQFPKKLGAKFPVRLDVHTWTFFRGTWRMFRWVRTFHNRTKMHNSNLLNYQEFSILATDRMNMFSLNTAGYCRMSAWNSEKQSIFRSDKGTYIDFYKKSNLPC